MNIFSLVGRRSYFQLKGIFLARSRLSTVSLKAHDMKLYSDKGNPFLLRILAAKCLANVSLEIEFVKPGDQVDVPFLTSHKLPVLEITGDQFLFSPNAICRYFLDLKKTSDSDPVKEAVTDQWVEWESSCLQPLVLPCVTSAIGHGRTDRQQVEALTASLDHLDSSLTTHSFLSGGNTVGLADVVLWGSLYPILAEKNKFGDVMLQNSAIDKWHANLMCREEFSEAVNVVTEGKGVQSFQSYFSIIQESLLRMSGEPLVQIVVTKADNKPTKPGKQAKPNSSATKVPARQFSSSSQDDEVNLSKAQVSSEELAASLKAWSQGGEHSPRAKKLEHPILPQEGRRNILITSALPYVNNVPHLGNIIGCVLSADVFSRFCRLRQHNSLYICGTDEYGTATETKALEEGLTPKQICDKYYKVHSEVYKWFNIRFDYFGRTTTQQQTEISQDIFWRLHKRGHILEDTVEQLRCLRCERFLADRFVEGSCPFCNYEDARGDQCDACGKLINATELKNPRCKVCGDKPEVRSSKHLFLDLSELQGTLESWVDKSSTEGMWSSNARHITRGWLKEGLKPRCITRDLKWGTPVPLEGFQDKVFYVWFDAPIGYLSITANYTKQWEKWWKNPEQVESYQFMAKDNVPFHTVVFPSTLLGADDNYTLLNSINATEYLNYEDDKFSKSRGVGVFGDMASQTGIPADIWRFYLLYVRPESQDSAFSWSDFAMKNNSELLNNLGNFVNRALMFVHNSFGGVLPSVDLNEEDKRYLTLVNRELTAYVDNLEKVRIREGLRNILSISKLSNQFIQANQPWVLMKGNGQEKARAGSVIGLATNVSWLISVLLQPYMPAVSAEIQTQLQVSEDGNVITENFIPFLPPGHQIGKPKPLFEKIDNQTVESLRSRFSGQKKTPPVKDSKKNKNAGSNGPPAKDSPQGGGSGGETPVDSAMAEKLQAQVTSQGDKVRQLKTAKADKAVIDAEVAILLDLKKKFAEAQGKPLDEGKGKRGKGKKK